MFSLWVSSCCKKIWKREEGVLEKENKNNDNESVGRERGPGRRGRER